MHLLFTHFEQPTCYVYECESEHFEEDSVIFVINGNAEFLNTR